MTIAAYPAFKNKASNPYNALLYDEFLKQGHRVDEFSVRNILLKRYDIIHIHWPPDPSPRIRKIPVLHSAFIVLIHLLEVLGKLKGAKVVWTVHNLQAHGSNNNRRERLRMTLFTRVLDGIICMNAATLPLLLKRYPALARTPNVLIPHGDYRTIYPNTVSREAARQRLGLDANARVVLFFGLIKQYKGIEDLLEVFNTQTKPDTTLVIAGALSEDQKSHFEPLFKALENKPGFRFHVQMVNNDDVQIFLNACDLVVLPYKNILNSGTLFLALSFSRPVLIKDHPSVREFTTEFGGWVSTYGDLTMATIDDALDTAPQGILPIPPSRNWMDIYRKTVAFYGSLHAPAKAAL